MTALLDAPAFAGHAPDPLWAPAFYTPAGDVEWDFSEGYRAVAIANRAMATPDNPTARLDPWQEWLLVEALAKHPVTGRFRFRQYVVSLGRQNGKTTLASALVLYLMLSHHYEPNVVSLASNVEQANIAYQRVLNLINAHPSLRRRFRKATETRGMITADGRGRYKCLPSKASALQGHTVTGVVADELHIMNDAVWHAITIGAGQIPNSIVFGITTAGDSDSSLLKHLYEQGMAGADGLGFALWEAPEGSRVDDIDALKAANPALACGRMSEEQVLSEVRLLPVPDATRYRLNRFIEQENSWLPTGVWDALPRLENERADRPVHLVVDRTPDWSGATVTANWVDDEGDLCTDVVASVVKPTPESLNELCMEVARSVSHTQFGVDDRYLPALADHLRLNGVQVRRLVLRDHINAAATSYAAILDGRVKHGHRDIVRMQMPRAVRKNVADGYRLTRTSTAVDLDACAATVLGIYLAATQPDTPLQVM